MHYRVTRARDTYSPSFLSISRADGRVEGVGGVVWCGRGGRRRRRGRGKGQDDDEGTGTRGRAVGPSIMISYEKSSADKTMYDARESAKQMNPFTTCGRSVRTGSIGSRRRWTVGVEGFRERRGRVVRRCVGVAVRDGGRRDGTQRVGTAEKKKSYMCASFVVNAACVYEALAATTIGCFGNGERERERAREKRRVRVSGRRAGEGESKRAQAPPEWAKRDGESPPITRDGGHGRRHHCRRRRRSVPIYLKAGGLKPRIVDLI